MHWACINEHPSVVRLLLEYEANVNATTTAGATPLQLSVANRSQVPVQLLMNVDSQVWWLAVVGQDAVRSRGRPVCSLVGIQVSCMVYIPRLSMLKLRAMNPNIRRQQSV